METYVTDKKNISEDHSGLFSMGIVFLLALPVYLLALSIVLSIFRINSPFHWLPLILNILFFGFVGLMFGHAFDFKEHHFLVSSGKDSYLYFLSPYGKTQAQIKTALNEKYRKKGYRAKRMVRIAIFWAIGIVIVVIARFMNPVLNGALVTYPIVLILGLLSSLSISEEQYLDEVASRWKECICPSCRSICSYYKGRISDQKDKSNVYSYTKNVTDKITDGVSTVYLEREQQRIGIEHVSTWKETYYCEKCKSHFSKDKRYTRYEQ